MFAISVLFAKGAFEHYLIERSVGMDDATFDAIMDGVADDPLGLRGLALGWDICWYGGIGLLWIAMVLTVISGADYFCKAIPYLKDSQ
jgi:CDP-diacylglycerol--glycerol-3-phosphate 3-phosphatidyltransferase